MKYKIRGGKKFYLSNFFRFFLSGLSGVILAFSFPPFNLWYLAWVGFLPLLFSLREKSILNFFLGWFAGFICTTILLSWLVKVAGPIYFILPIYLGLYWGIFSFLLCSLQRKGRIFIGACIWFFLEILVTHLLTGFPWLLLGLSQWKNSIILPFAGISGIYGISSLIILANLSLFYGFRKRYVVSLLVSILIFLSVSIYGKNFGRETFSRTYTIKVLIVQENISSTEKKSAYEILNSYYDTTAKILKKEKGVELVIWPESTFPDYLLEDKKILRKLIKFTKRYKCTILLGSVSKKNGNIYNSAFFIAGEKIQTYNKIHLVPYGEFIPGGKFHFIERTYEKIAHYIPVMKHGKEFTLFNFKEQKISSLICFENIFPEITREFVKEGCNAFIVITNDSWFDKSFGPYQHFTHNVFRAVESGKYFVQTSTTGISGIISPSGKIEHLIENNGEKTFVKGILVSEIPILKKQTFYSKYGDIPFFLLTLIFMGVLL